MVKGTKTLSPPVKCYICGKETNHPYSGEIPSFLLPKNWPAKPGVPLCITCWHLIIDSAGIFSFLETATKAEKTLFKKQCVHAMYGPMSQEFKHKHYTWDPDKPDILIPKPDGPSDNGNYDPFDDKTYGV